MDPQFSNPKVIAERGEKIYNEKYRAEFEKKHLGKSVVIDVTSESAYVADTAEGAFEQARKVAPGGFFHLIKVGEPGAFRVSHTSSASLDWFFQ